MKAIHAITCGLALAVTAAIFTFDYDVRRDGATRECTENACREILTYHAQLAPAGVGAGIALVAAGALVLVTQRLDH